MVRVLYQPTFVGSPQKLCYWFAPVELQLNSSVIKLWNFVSYENTKQLHLLMTISQCWSWNSNTLSASCKELTDLKRPWCWEGLGAGVEEDDRGWDGCMASSTQWTWVCIYSRNWWWTGRPGVLHFMGSQRVVHDRVTELNNIYKEDFMEMSVGDSRLKGTTCKHTYEIANRKSSS